MDFRDTPEYHGSTEVGLSSGLIGMSTIMFGLRIFVRLFVTKSFGLDDGLTVVAYLALMVLTVMDISAVSLGSGTHISYVPEDILYRFFELLSIQSILYFWVMALVRFAILAFIPRIVQDKIINRISWAVAAIIAAQTIGATVYRLTECIPFGDNFKSPDTPGLHCVGLKAHNGMMMGHGVIGIIVDMILLILPIWIICTKMIWSKKTLQIVLVLSIGVFAIATAIIRVALLAAIYLPIDLTWMMPFLTIWSGLEAHVGMWCCCFPALQPILRTMAPNKTRAVSAIYNNSSHTRYKPGTQDNSNSTRKECETNASRHYEMLNGSQRTIILPEKRQEDATRGGRDASPV
ncbi:hypothetical protein F4820DRAFT_239403 [Hypoxylon rubiginosum]|uniref:Uncharacterized protein n=1 Tax=Hypoxylon rubiginosum TaxID=110542 RepID=A0ACB9Z5D9_9PEZI|nr:hypothetical protein F4820DRAFT_239403 [Hypoxylon rubiginosum]